MVVVHDDKKHFHIHIMVNKVHPETFKAHTPYRNWLTLDAAMRVLEAKYGWTHTAGPTRWDEESKQAVRASRSERNALHTARQQPTGAAAKFEHYHDEESLQTYVRCEVAPRVRTLLTRQNVSWEALHALLAKYHLRIEKGESGGYLPDYVIGIDERHLKRLMKEYARHYRDDRTHPVPVKKAPIGREAVSNSELGRRIITMPRFGSTHHRCDLEA